MTDNKRARRERVVQQKDAIDLHWDEHGCLVISTDPANGAGYSEVAIDYEDIEAVARAMLEFQKTHPDFQEVGDANG